MAKEESLRVYWGGLFVSPSPLEISLNWCSANCNYCFANLSKPDRRANVKQIMNLLADLGKRGKDGTYKRKTYTAHLLRHRYPVTISNHVDPLASSNLGIIFPLLEALQAYEIPFTVLTKFNRRKDLERLLDTLDKPTVFYASITTLDPEVQKANEPGAASPQERLESVELIRARGHRCLVGINPIVPGWVDDPLALVQAIKAAGAEGIWIQNLHLSQNHMKNMPKRDQERLGAYAIEYGRKQHKDHREALFNEFRDCLVAEGIEYHHSGSAHQSKFFDVYRQTYAKTFPVYKDLINWCHVNKKVGDPIFFGDFVKFLVDSLPGGRWELSKHAFAGVFGAVMGRASVPQYCDYPRLIRATWDNYEVPINPINLPCFAWAALPDENNPDKWIKLLDDQALPVLIWLGDDHPNVMFTDKHPYA